MKRLLALAVLGGLIPPLGCSKPATPTDAPTAAADAGQPTVAATRPAPCPRPQGEGPDTAVYDFLEAVRTGDDAMAGKMLTPLARQKVAEKQMVVAPPGTDTARFEMGKVQPREDQSALVTIRWIDLDENGNTRADDVVWVVRRVDEGWRVSGAAVPVFDNESPVELNFEDPDDMIEKQKMVRQKMRERTEQAAAAAAQTAEQGRPEVSGPVQPMPNGTVPGEQPATAVQAANPENAVRR